MKFYIIDDDPAIPKMLQQIIEQDSQNTVIGIANSSKKALSELFLMDVDIVLIDLLMPNISGIELIKRLSALKPQLRFIMISQVKDAELRAEAYEAGIEFFIDKPINVIEVHSVIKRVCQSLQMATKLDNIQKVIGATAPIHAYDPIVQRKQMTKEKTMSILRFLGITSEAGSADILLISKLMNEQNLRFNELNFNDIYQINDREKKVLLQRIRRAVKTGLINLANMFLDGLDDEISLEYANALYEYKNVRHEIDYLQGKRAVGGKISLKHFFDGLIQEI